MGTPINSQKLMASSRILEEIIAREKRELEESMQSFEQTNAAMIQDLKDAGWDLCPEFNMRSFQVELLQMAGPELAVFARAAAYSARGQDGWVYDRSDWEQEMNPSVCSQQRQDFLGMCLKMGCTDEFIVDAKKRWARADFTSVTDQWISLGDVFVSRRGGKLQNKLEVDQKTEASSLGRDSLTYEIWRQEKFAQSIKCLRPKINGERFGIVVESGKKLLRGFKDFEVPRDFPYDLLEYYAGTFYVLYPITTKGSYMSLKSKDGDEFFTFAPHPFLTPKEFVERKATFFFSSV